MTLQTKWAFEASMQPNALQQAFPNAIVPDNPQETMPPADLFPKKEREAL